MAIQYSKTTDFHTTAITHSKDKEELVFKLGADSVVNNGDALKHTDGGGGSDILLVTSNSYKAAVDALKGLRPDGRIVLMGASAQPFVVTAGDMIANRWRILGSTQNGHEYLYEALDYVAKGKVKIISETFSLENVSEAYEKV